MEKLEEIANSIPSQGGREIGYYLRDRAAKVKEGCDIVEVGSWLGAGTAQICLGILDGKNDASLHIYDRFKAGATEVKKAKKQGMKIESKQDTLPIVKKFISYFKCRTKFYRVSIKSIKPYKGKKIGLYVDDASKRKEYFDHVMDTFKKHFIPGETILILMDFFYFEWKPKIGLEYQFNYMKDNPEFEFIERIKPDLSAAAFLYKGEKINLKKHAESIEELGSGGLTIKDDLFKYSKEVSANGSIVEIGPWFGSATAFMCLGILKSKSNAKIYAYDRWNLDENMQRKLLGHHGIEREVGETVEDIFIENIETFNVDVEVCRQRVREMTWNGGDISLLVDDICNGKNRFDKMMKTFSPYFIPGKTILILMDYYHYERRGSEYMKYQDKFMRHNNKVFEFVKKSKGYTAIYKYLDGEPEYIEGESYMEED